MERYTDEQYMDAYHFAAWLLAQNDDNTVREFFKLADDDWMSLPKNGYTNDGMNTWCGSDVPATVWDKIDDEWMDHVAYCGPSIPPEYLLPDGALDAITQTLDMVERLCSDPDLEPTEVTTIQARDGNPLGEVKNITDEARVFLLWLTVEGGVKLVSEFLDYADDDWASNDIIDFVTLALDWASTPRNVRGWRKANNHWRVYLSDNEDTKTDDMGRSLFFLGWLKDTHGVEAYEDFLDNSKEFWERQPRKDYVNAGMELWAHTRLGVVKWEYIYFTWRQAVNDD